MNERYSEDQIELHVPEASEGYISVAATVLGGMFLQHENIRMHLENGTMIHKPDLHDKLKSVIENNGMFDPSALSGVAGETVDDRINQIQHSKTYDELRTAMLGAFKKPEVISHVLATAMEDFDDNFKRVYQAGSDRADLSLPEESGDDKLHAELSNIKVSTRKLIIILATDFSQSSEVELGSSVAS